jgi:hypothetical protein
LGIAAMAMACTDCGYYSADNEETCPTCNVKLRMTFLPPPNAVLAAPVMPAPLAAGTPTYPMPDFRSSYDIFEIILRNRFITAIVAIPLILFGFWLSGITSDNGPRGKYNAIRLGMSPDQVQEILYSDTRFSHSSRVSTTGDAQMSYTDGPIKIVVYFRDGKVVNKQMTGNDDIEDAIASGLETPIR